MSLRKNRLLTPGPTQVPESARLAMARDVVHHRTPQFRALFAEVLAGLKEVLQTQDDVLVLASSGTGAMEAAVTNLAPRGGKVIVLDAGRFAQRWAEIATAFGIEVVRHQVTWGQAVDPADVARLLVEHPDAVAVYGTLMESSTGVAHDVEAIARVVRPTRAVFVVDGISGAGCVECRTSQWGIDMLVVGSQKALMCPPGLAFVTVSDKARRQIESIQPQSFYFNLRLHLEKLRGDADTPWTPAITLISGLAESLRLIRGAGMENVWRRSRRLAGAMRAGASAIGLEVFAQRPADGMTAIRVPDAIGAARLLQRLEERFGLKLAGGQGPLKGKIFRIAHFGLVDELDLLATLAALELVLLELGAPVALGAGVAAASGVLAGGK
ncbi:MAG: alanine--glyoxylate aminotransferase family protein [Pirellulales bacterium]|nr:alanine--glyoxylate aminotransferase family protein [Pirellulales bacterium]